MKKDFKTISRSGGKLKRPAFAGATPSSVRRSRQKKSTISLSGAGLLGAAEKFLMIALPVAGVTLALFALVATARYVRDTGFFTVRTVVVGGNSRVSTGELKTLALGDRSNLFSIKLGDAKRRLLENPWVERTNIRKVYPDMLLVSVAERKPVGIMNIEGRLSYIDREGNSFKEISVDDDLGLPLVTAGQNEDIRGYPMEVVNWILSYFAWNPVLSKEKISQIGYSSATGFKIFLASHNEIRLGTENFEEKLVKLEKIVTHLGGRQLRPRFVDLNVKSSVVVKVAKK